MPICCRVSHATKLAPSVLRSARVSLTAAIDYQIVGAVAETKGETYVVEVEKWIETDATTGTKERRKVQKPLRRMWYRNAGDAISWNSALPTS